MVKGQLNEYFLFLVTLIRNSEKCIKVRKAKAWATFHKVINIWKSNMKRSLKVRLFTATVESVLLYGSEKWILSKSLTKTIDSCYTRMLRIALDVSWKERKSNADLCGELPKLKVSSKIGQIPTIKAFMACTKAPWTKTSQGSFVGVTTGAGKAWKTSDVILGHP